MKKQSKLIRPAAVVLLCLLLSLALPISGCAQASLAKDLMAGVEAAEWPETPVEPDDRFKGSFTGFAWDFFRESALNQGNVLVAPASVFFALSIALNGADSETKEAMLDVLAAKGLSADELNAACRDWSTLLSRTSEKTKLSISNSIWYRQEFSPEPNFLQKNADYFNAAAKSLDFSQQSAVDTINAWVKKSTNNKIDKIVEEIDPDVVMYLINAIYFKSDWKTPFLTAETAERDFSAPGAAVRIPFMNRLDKMTYLEYQGLRGVMLPYVDERYAMVFALPAEGTDPRTAVSGMGSADFAALLASGKEQTVQLALPKFEVKFEDSLLNELDQLGMGIAFDPNQADFSLMNAAHEANLYISEVKHKTFCRVDEKGTEAAAVTSVEMRETSMPQVDQELVFDRPFLYGIIDTKTGLPLFLGLMENPAG